MTALTTGDTTGQGLARLLATLCEDATFVIASVDALDRDALDAYAKRREAAYDACVKGTPPGATMIDRFDAWVAESTRAIAPVAAPAWLPMGDLLREKVTLEAGARGLRSLFSSKPSEKDVERVKKVGALATRVLRAVYAADGPLDSEEERAIALLVNALGLAEKDAAAMLNEAPVAAASLEVYGELEAPIGKAIVRGAWLAAAWDAIDPREEDVVRAVAKKLGVGDDAVESARGDAVKWVDARAAAGKAVVDAIRYVLADRVPGIGIALASKAGTLILPRRHRDEALGQLAHGADVTLAKRHSLSGAMQQTVLAIAWAAALHDDPGLSRRALLRARFERVAHDLGSTGDKPRAFVDAWIDDTLFAGAPK